MKNNDNIDRAKQKITEKKQKHKERVSAVAEVKKERTAAANNTAKGKTAAKGKTPVAVTQNRLELLVTIVSRKKAEYYVDLIQSFDVNMQVMALASGTANAEMLSLLGLTENEKTVIFSVIQSEKLPDALSALEEKFKAIRGGKGIAYTIPFTSVIGTLIFGFLSNNRSITV